MVTPWSFDCGHPRFSAGVVFARDAAVRVLPWLIMRERELAKIEEFREAFGKMNPLCDCALSEYRGREGRQ